MNTLSLSAGQSRPPAFTWNAAYLALLGTDLLLFAGWIVELAVADPMLKATMQLDLYVRGLGVFCLGAAALTILGVRTWMLALPMFNAVSAIMTLAIAVAGFGSLTGAGVALMLVLALIDAEFAWFQRRIVRDM